MWKFVYNLNEIWVPDCAKLASKFELLNQFKQKKKEEEDGKHWFKNIHSMFQWAKMRFREIYE